MIDMDAIRRRFCAFAPFADERMRRLAAAAEAKAIGRGGISAVCRATGVSRDTIRAGLAELEGVRPRPAAGHMRQAGGGRKPVRVYDPELVGALEALVEPTSRGDPESSLRWSCRSTRTLARALREVGHPISHSKVGEILHEQRYSLQGNRKTEEGTSHPDRDAQFRYIASETGAALAGGEPVISVDAKKKELVGNLKNPGRTWRPQGQPEEVLVHDLVGPKQGRAIPYGVYDLARNQGWVRVGIDHDTAEFAVETIRQWWQQCGRSRYPQAKHLRIVADGGGSNGVRHRLWKWALQQWVEETGLSVTVHHLPPGTSKWNKIEHRLFAQIGRAHV
jgi:hypothetical protein